MDSGEPSGTKGNIRIAPIAERDFATYSELAAEHEMFAKYDLTPERLRENLASPAVTEHRVLIAEADGEPAGLVWLVKNGAFSRSGYIRLLVTASRHLGTGVGDRLMDAAEEELLVDNSDVLLLVNAANTRARRFYERRGYFEVGALLDYVVPGQAECIYRKLSRPAGA
jgi:ribosomal protein S18 acetylase RimI-like enzyme